MELFLLLTFDVLLDMIEKVLSFVMNKVVVELGILTDELGRKSCLLDLLKEELCCFLMTKENLDFDFVVRHI